MEAMLPTETVEKLVSAVNAISSQRAASRRDRAIVSVAAAVVTKYISHVNLLLQMMERQHKLLQMLILLRKRRRAAKTMARWTSFCCPGVRNLLLDYLRDDTLDFERHFRVGRPVFRRLRALVTSGGGWGADVELLVFLHWLGAGASYRTVSATFGMPRSGVRAVVCHHVDRLAARIRDVVRVPRDREELETVCSGFAALCRTSGAVSRVAGVVDSCSVQPSTGDVTVQMQAVCDHRGRFLDFSVGYPPSFSPAEVFRASPFYESAAYPPDDDCFLLGGEGYPCLLRPVQIVAPYPDPPKTEAEAAFNAVCRRALAVLHDAFVQMTGRWKAVFERCLKVLPRRTAKVVAVCALVHNLCVEEGRPWREAPGDREDLEVVCPARASEADAESALALRALLAQRAAEDAVRTLRVDLDHDYWLAGSVGTDHDYLGT